MLLKVLRRGCQDCWAPPFSWPHSSLATGLLQQGRPGNDGHRSKERRDGFGWSLAPAVERLKNFTCWEEKWAKVGEPSPVDP